MCIQTETSPKVAQALRQLTTEMLDISSLRNHTSCKPFPSPHHSSRSTFAPISLFGHRKSTPSFPEVLKRNYQARIDEEIATMKKELKEMKSYRRSSVSNEDNVDRKRPSLSSWTSFSRRKVRSNSIVSLTPTV